MPQTNETHNRGLSLLSLLLQRSHFATTCHYYHPSSATPRRDDQANYGRGKGALIQCVGTAAYL